MISRRPLYSILVGVLLAAGALAAIFQWRGTHDVTSAGQAPADQKVIVAARDLPFGTRLTPDMVKEAAWPAGTVPGNAVVSVDELAGGAEGPRIAIRSMVAGEPLLRSKVSGFGETSKMSRRVPLAMRAYSVRMTDVSGVSGFVLPGDRVDVLLTRTDAQGRLAAEVVLQDLTILAIDQTRDEDSDDPILAKTATIQVTPEQAQVLALAEQLGTLSLALRNYADNAKPVLGKLVLDNSTAAAVAPSATGAPTIPHASRIPPRRPEVTVRRGTAVTVESVSDQ